MANMGYCRFENTLQDLKDCYNHMEDENLSKSEKVAKQELIELCRQIIDENSEE